MKNYLKLSSLSEAITRIIPSEFKSNAKKVKKELPFVVLNSDNDYGFYVKRLVRELQRYDLIEQPKVLRKKSLKNIESGDIIVFGDNLGSIDYDYRVETNARNLDHLDGRTFKAYDLINDFDKVIKRLRKYVAENSEEHLLVKDNDDSVSVTNIEVEVNVSAKRPKYVTPVALLLNKVSEEKVTIFDNWVKIGYNQYDIYVDLFGREFIYVDGRKFQIEEDRLGRKYLTN